MNFFECSVCGQIVGIVKDTRRPLSCCDEEMPELVPGTIDASVEKHVPVFASSGTMVEVAVGSELHPMTGSHYIEWIALETEMGNQRKRLKPGDEPYACFSVCEGDKVIAAYAYCNLHKLWKG